MAISKKALNLAVPVDLLDEFEEVCGHYGHGKQKGMVLSAAILMFLRADPSAQAEYLEQIAVADIAEGMKSMLQRAKEQQDQGARAGSSRRTGAGGRADGKSAGRSSAPRKAAKKAGKSIHALSELPTLDKLQQQMQGQKKRRRRQKPE